MKYGYKTKCIKKSMDKERRSIMFEDDQNDKNGPNNPPNTLLREEVIEINGEKVSLWREIYVKKSDGSIVR